MNDVVQGGFTGPDKGKVFWCDRCVEVDPSYCAAPQAHTEHDNHEKTSVPCVHDGSIFPTVAT